MSAPDLHTAITVSGGKMATSGAALGSAPVTALLTAWFGSDALTVTNAAITSQPADADVVVHGDVTLIGVTVTGDFRFFIDGDTAQLELAGNLPNNWKLGDSFASLKQSYVNSFSLSAPTLALRSEKTAHGDAGLSVDGGFALPGPLEALRSFVAPAANARIGGPIALEKNLPVMTLSVSPTMRASLGNYVDIDLTMQQLSMVQQGDPGAPPALPDDPDADPDETLDQQGAPAEGTASADVQPAVAVISQLNGNLSFQHSGSTVKVPMTAAFNDNLGLLKLKLGTSQIFDLALGEISHWIGGTDLSTAALPSQYSPSTGLTLHDVEFGIGLKKVGLQYVALTIVSTEPWKLTDQIQIQSGIALTFKVTPGTKQKLDATITGTIQLGAALIDVYAHYPDFTISGQLHDDTPVDLTGVLSQLGAVTAGVPTLQISVLKFSANPAGSNYSFDLDIDGDWTIVSGLKVEALKAHVSYQKSALNLLFAGNFRVGGVDLAISAEYDSVAPAGWLFSGRAAQDTPIKIGAFITQLASDFSSTAANLLPDFLSTLEIKAISVTFDTASKDFEFGCETTLEIDGTELDLTLRVSLKNGEGGKYTHLYAGVLVIGTFTFDLAFEKTGDGSTDSSMLLATMASTTGVDIRALVAGVSSEAGALMPELTLTLEQALFLYRSTGTDSSYLFGLAIGLDMNLQSLPLIGPVLADAGIGGLKDVQALYASAPVTADQVMAINALMGELQTTPPLPTKKDATGTTQVLDKGFNFSANLDMGNAPVALIAGGPTAPPNVPAPPPSAPVAPPAGNASWYDVHKSIGPATLERIGFRYEGGRAWILVDADFTLSGLSMGLQGLAIGTKLDDLTAISVNLDGMSIEFSSGPLTIEGGFLHLNDDYLGEARVQAASFGLTAIGGYAPNDESFFIFVRLNAPLGGPPFFFITGIAGGFGINRALTIPPIDQLTSFALLPANNTFPPTLGANPGQTLAATLATTESFIHPQAGNNWVAAGLDFTTFEMVDSSALVTVSFGVDFAVALLGISRVTIPKGAPEPIVYLEIALEAQFKPSAGLFSVDGRITPASFIYAKLCRITGGFAFYLWFAGANEGDFVISIGGYHPRFKKPDHYPVVPRLQLTYQIGSLVITGQCYFALTPHMLMAGMRIDATWNCGSLSAWFNAGIDFLLGWRPFHYEADAYVHIGVSLTIDLLFTSVRITIHVGVDLNIWGPEFGGNASIDLDIVSFTISFGADPKQDAVDWAGFTEAFLPKGKTQAAAPAHMLAATKFADAAPLDANTLWCTGSVTTGLVKDLKAADATSFFSWLVDANQFALQANTLIPAKTGRYNEFDLHAPFTAKGGFTTASTGDTPTAFYDTTAFPNGVTWATDFGVLPMQLSSAGFTTSLLVELLKTEPGEDHTNPANYTDHVDSISVTPLVKPASAALWAGADPGLNGGRLIANALVGMQLTPMAQHPDITFKADLWAMLFNQGLPIIWQAVVPATDKTDSYNASANGSTLTFTLAAGPVTCKDYMLTALTLAPVAQARHDTVAGLAALGLALDPASIDVATLATYPMWDWPMICTLGEERLAA